MVQAWRDGLKLHYFYDYPDLCLDQVELFLDQLYPLYVNITDITLPDSSEPSTLNDDWYQIMFNITNIISNPFNEAFYNCFLFVESIVEQQQNYNTQFTNASDFYISFLFNLLANSVHLEAYASQITLDIRNQQWIDLHFQIASVLRVILLDLQPTYGDDLVQEDLDFARRVLENLYRQVYQEPTEGPSTISLILNITFGLFDGALGALPQDSTGYLCNSNLTTQRQQIGVIGDLFNRIDQVENDEIIEAIFDYNANLYDVSFNCYYSVAELVSIDFTSFFLPANILNNFLNNMGYLYNDIFNLLVETPQSQKNYSYFVAYNVGDFIMRLFYSEDLNQKEPNTPRALPRYVEAP